MVNYYPQELSFKSVSAMQPALKLVNFAEEQRLFDVDQRKKRGKGAPKKARTKGKLIDIVTMTYAEYLLSLVRGEQTPSEEEEKVDSCNTILTTHYTPPVFDFRYLNLSMNGIMILIRRSM